MSIAIRVGSGRGTSCRDGMEERFGELELNLSSNMSLFEDMHGVFIRCPLVEHAHSPDIFSV